MCTMWGYIFWSNIQTIELRRFNRFTAIHGIFSCLNLISEIINWWLSNISVMLICCVFIRQAIGSFVSPGRKGCFSTITLDIINDKPDWSWLSFVLRRMFLDGRLREANILLPYFSISPNILISQRPIFDDGDIFDAEDWISEIKLHGRDGDEIYFPQKSPNSAIVKWLEVTVSRSQG